MKEPEKLNKLLHNAVAKNAQRKKFALLFSSGIDSLLLAVLLKKQGVKFKCFYGYLKGLGKPKDLEFVKRAAKRFDLELETVSVSLNELPSLISKVVPVIGSTNPVTVGIALPLFVACEKAGKQKMKVVLSGQGADELFGGYARFKNSKNIKADMGIALAKLLENDLDWNKAIAKTNGLELKLPYLEKNIVKFASGLQKKFKVQGQRNKVILRDLAADLDIPREFAERKKLAAQYGSNFDKAIIKLAKKEKKSKSDYLAQFGQKKIAALFSGGKDSCLALWRMQQQGFKVECLLSVLPENEFSFMYHKPKLSLLRLQSKALGIPLLIERIKGEKEKELVALKKILAKAKKECDIIGVVGGALYSNYQRKRIQKICDDLHLELFSPLWHMGQEKELHELHASKFSFILTKVAGLGLNKGWLGKPIGKKEIAELGALNKKMGFNVAGEGGEYESLVINAPNFKKKMVIERTGKKMQNEHTGFLEIKKATLSD
tara:strand:- start:4866 stop:6335 length:1470 start_codon:yes stop_codon:yes gene_type:complete